MSGLLFGIFAATLVAVMLFHRRSLECAALGLALIFAVRLGFTQFDLGQHLREEWVGLANLFGLLVGFPLLADHVQDSRLPAALPRVLPRGTAGCFAWLAIVWALSGVLDNIAAAMIGAAVARDLFKGKVHLGYLAAIVAAANAGGAGSVLGDTTTTMMWIAGVGPIELLPAYAGALAALIVFGLVAARQQHRHAPLDAAADAASAREPVDGPRLALVAAALTVVIAANATAAWWRPHSESVPLLALVIWAALIAGAPLRAPKWRLIPGALRGALFLVALVLCASLMPLQALPRPSWGTTLLLGLVSSVFDNIPLTKLALDQGGYDWPLLAYAVGLGGSMLWFGSSAGVAVAGLFPEIRSIRRWLSQGWHVVAGFLVGFIIISIVRAGFR